MSYGLQVFDASGGVVLDVSDRLTRFYADYSVSITPGQPVYIPVPGMVDDGTWAVIPQAYIVNVLVGSGGFTVSLDAYWGNSPTTYKFVVMRL